MGQLTTDPPDIVDGDVLKGLVTFSLRRRQQIDAAGFQILLFSIAARIYPTQIRGTGIGSAHALGRLGAIISSFAGALMLNIDPTGTQFFWFVSLTMGLAMIAVLKIKSLRVSKSS